VRLALCSTLAADGVATAQAPRKGAWNKMRSIALKVVWSAAVLGFVFFPNWLYAGVPTDQIRGASDQVLEILNNPKLRSESAKEERRAQLRQLIYPRFDFAEMARRSLGATWQKVSAREQEEFVTLFTQLLEESYVSNIESYSGEKIVYGREIMDQDFAEVDTTIITNKGEEFAINYKLHELNGDWKAYDIVIENVSIVNNYRSQFSRLLRKGSFPELLDTIREKLKSFR
jgi:phospholipid transport system substrate-binding protein